MEKIISKENIHIIDSYKVEKEFYMLVELNEVRKKYSKEECLPLKRSNDSLVNEWRGHNLCYDLHLFRKHTKDVDLGAKDNIFRRIFYWFVGNIYCMYN